MLLGVPHSLGQQWLINSAVIVIYTYVLDNSEKKIHL